MKNMAIMLAVLAIVGGVAAYVYVQKGEQKNQELELVARKAEAAQKKAEAAQKQAEAEEKRAKSEERAAAAKKDAALNERQAKHAAEAEAKELAKAKAAEADKAEAVRKTAESNARKAEAERKAAEARKAEAQALAEHAAATNAIREAELQTALAAERMVALDLQKIIASSNVLALQKADYARKMVEVEKLQEELRRREEETRPNKTLMQLMEQNDAAREAELAEMAKRDAQYAEEESVRRRILREGIPSAPKKPLSPTEQRLADANEAIDRATSERATEEDARIVARLEPLIRQAVKDGRTEDAEAYLAALRSLVPGYDGGKK